MKYFFLFSFIVLFFFISPASAQLLSPEIDGVIYDQTEALAIGAGFDESATADTVPNTIASIIKVFLGFLGIIFIILVIWAGYNWMTAGGNEEKVTKARTTIFRAVIGLIIIVSAYAITHFVFGAIDSPNGP